MLFLQFYWNLGHSGLGAGGAGDALDHHVERPLQPQHLQLLLWGRGGSVDHQVQSTNTNSKKSIFCSKQVHTRHVALLVQPDDFAQAGQNIPGNKREGYKTSSQARYIDAIAISEITH